jgi:hypothetical protein
LFSIVTPLGTSKIDFGVGNLDSTGFAPSVDIVLKEFDPLPTLRTRNIENIPRFPIPQVLSRTLHDVSLAYFDLLTGM